ncbi:MAG: DUF4328 domain-containing protein [Sphingomonadaceae bacterium]|nr:DUF4328 domain-containing protein [Sphingomonadaceae bacterium]
MLIAYMAVLGISALIGCYVAWTEFNSFIGNIGRGAPVILLAANITTLVAVPMTILYLMWLYRAVANLYDLRLDGLKYTPGWTVGSYFIPLVNMVMPFLTMRQLYNRSHGEIPELADSSVDQASSWWACVIAGGALQAAWTMLLFVDSIPFVFVIMPPWSHTLLLILSQLLGLGASWFLFKLVGSITDAQRSGALVVDAFA